MLTENEDLQMTAALANDQAISQTLFADAVTMRNMEAFQKRFNAGESLTDVYWSGK
jgi:hypothetical protein